jgi:Holliday junction DNA helicase RuvB
MHDAETEQLDRALRPVRFDDYVGQPKLVARLKIALWGALSRGEPMGHVLLHGPPGLGKTTLARIIAAESGATCHEVTAPSLADAGELLKVLARLSAGDVLFVDEIHGLDPLVEEALYPAMEDGAVDVPTPTGPRSAKLPPFTLVGATTRASMLTGALRSRFGVVGLLEPYAPADLATIVAANARKLGLDLPEGSIHLIATRCRGTPRTANRLLRCLRDYAAVVSDGDTSPDATLAMLDLEGIDDAGLGEQDRQMLRVMIGTYYGGPVGIEAVAASMGEDPETVAGVVEPYLIRCGFLTRTPRGRRVTKAAYDHLSR